MSTKFPGANLIAQVIRQIAKPMSKTIVKRVKNRPLLRKYVLVHLGRLYYWFQDQWRRFGNPDEKTLIKVRGKKPVDDIKAMELGTQMLLEVMIFGGLCFALMYETIKSAERSRNAEARRVKEGRDLEVRKDELIERVKNQQDTIRELKEFAAEYSKIINCPLPPLPATQEEVQDNGSTT